LASVPDHVAERHQILLSFIFVPRNIQPFVAIHFPGASNES
jgi:hypothetical protein